MGEVVALLFAVLLLLAAPAQAHPGRLDEHGCHWVHPNIRWIDKDGTVFEPGTYHCHRKLGEMKLDGLERLQTPEAAHEAPKEPDKK